VAKRSVDKWWANLPGYPPRDVYPELDREHVIYYPSDLSAIDPATIWAKPNICCYVHIPFCQHLCDFCVFLKFRPSGEEEAYLAALKKEIDFYSRLPQIRGRLISALYLGGGTPSVLSARQLADLIGHLRARLPFAEGVEIEMEAHPLSVDPAKLETLREKGVERISFGVQSFSDSLLRSIGSAHTADQARHAIGLAHQAGFPKVGLDLMFGRPGETSEDWAHDVESAIELNPASVSTYRLRVAPHTPLARRTEGSKLWDREGLYELWKDGVARFNSRGYGQYGGTDFARPGGESRYYRGFCRAPQQEVLGFGAGTMSYIHGHVYVNIHNLAEYAQSVAAGRLPVLMGRRIDAAEAMSRYIVLGLKSLEVSKPEFRKLFGFGIDDLYPEQLETLEGHGLIRNDVDAIRLTSPLGTFYVNNVCKYFFTPNNWGKPQPLRYELINVGTPSLSTDSALTFLD